MAIFEIKGQDGAIYEVNAPDEATALKAFQGFIAPKQKGHANVPEFDPGVPGYDPSTGMVNRPPSLGEDVLRSAGTGLRDAAEGAVGFAGDIPAISTGIQSWIAEKLGASPEYLDRLNKSGEMFDQANFFPSSKEIHDKTSGIIGPSYDPQTAAGEWARTGGQFAPMLASPGSATRKGLSWLGATAGKEGGERGAKALGFDEVAPYVGFVGAVLGGGIPGITGGSIATAAREAGTRTEALTRVIKRMQQDGYSPAAINARLKELGNQSTLMDAGPNLRQEGQRIVAKGGDGRNTIDSMIRERDAGANARIQGEVDRNFGPAPVPDDVISGIKADQRAIAPRYGEVLKQAGPVDTSRIASYLDREIGLLRGDAQRGVRNIRRMLDRPGTSELETRPAVLLQTRQAIDDMIQSAKGGNETAALSTARQAIDDQLRASVPNLKEVDAMYADLGRQKEAVGRGQQFLDSGKTAPRPSQVRAELEAGSLPEGELVGPSGASFRLRQGVRAEIDRIIGTNANDRVALQRIIKGDGDWNRDRLAAAFGQDKADRVMAALDREKTFAETSNRTIHNSATAERMSEGTGFSARDAYKAGGLLGALRSGAVYVGDAVLDRVRGQAAAARDADVAKLLSSRDRNKIVTALMKANGGKSVGQKQIEQAVKMLLLVPGARAQFGE